MSDDFEPERILGLLTAKGVDFVLIGGFAAVLHGSPRVTRDVDICFATDVENRRALASVLRELHARPSGVADDVPFDPDEKTLWRIELLTLDTDLGRLDLTSAPHGAPPYDRLRRNAARYDIGGFVIRVAEIPDLIRMKRAADRPRDRGDVAELEAILRLRARGV